MEFFEIVRADWIGKILIPKEIREFFEIRTGDALSIYIDEDIDAICIKKVD